MTKAARDMTEFRNEYIRGEVVPWIKRKFEKYDLQSAYLMVAQFWSDEADDAVHYEILWSRLPKPDLTAGFASRDDDEIEDQTNLGATQASIDNFDVGNSESWDDAFVPSWDENLGMIPLFAQYCEEDCHQEMVVSEAYKPCILFEWDGTEIKYSLIGKNLRPWLEGVTPEWMSDEDLEKDELPPWLQS